MAEGIPRPESGILVFEADLAIENDYDLGLTPYGARRVVVINGGSVKGAKLEGSILPGGLDSQLTLGNGVIEIEQLLILKTSDGRYVYMRNAGTGADAKDVRTVFDFEAPTSGAVAWLNTGKYVGRRVVDSVAKTMKIAVYDVSELAVQADAAHIVRVAKPADRPPQPWEYRHASPNEQAGEPIVTELVTLGAGQQIGASKRGNRNVIPITGGTLSGRITGKVLFGGADYQNFSNAPTIDARYLWKTDDGDVIIVRNTGPFGSLIPTFEVRTDSKYAWLNRGTYKSSNPGMGAGGVTITMYESK